MDAAILVSMSYNKQQPLGAQMKLPSLQSRDGKPWLLESISEALEYFHSTPPPPPPPKPDTEVQDMIAEGCPNCDPDTSDAGL